MQKADKLIKKFEKENKNLLTVKQKLRSHSKIEENHIKKDHRNEKNQIDSKVKNRYQQNQVLQIKLRSRSLDEKQKQKIQIKVNKKMKIGTKKEKETEKKNFNKRVFSKLTVNQKLITKTQTDNKKDRSRKVELSKEEEKQNVAKSQIGKEQNRSKSIEQQVQKEEEKKIEIEKKDQLRQKLAKYAQSYDLETILNNQIQRIDHVRYNKQAKELQANVE